MKTKLYKVLPLTVLLTALFALAGPAGAQTGTVTFEQPPDRYPTGNPSEAELTSVTNADFDSDGDADLAVTNTQSSSVSVFLSNDDGTFGNAITTMLPCPSGSNPTPPCSSGPSPRPMNIVGADFDRDGNDDVAVTSPPNGGVFVGFGNDDGTFRFTPDQFYATGTRAFGITAAQLNGDSRIDLAITNLGPRSGGAGDLNRDTVSVLLNNPPDGSGGVSDGSDGQFTPAIGGPYQAGDSPSSVAAGDLDSDGDLDLAVTNDRTTPQSDDISTFINAGDGDFEAGPEFQSGSTPKTTTGGDTRSVGDFPTGIASSDFDRDGNPDLVVANLGPEPPSGSTSNGPDTVSVLLNTSTGDALSFAKTDYEALDGPRAVTVADFDLDGDPDFAVPYQNNSDPSNAFISVYLNSGNSTGTFGPPQNFQGGVDSRGITSADFNQDLKPDLAAPDRSTTPDSVLVLLNTTKGTPDSCTIRGTDRDDTLTGTLGKDVICGFGGNDSIDGRGGNDIIKGGEGRDSLDGGAGNDEVFGGAGNDTINIRDGVRGNDRAGGGSGRDECKQDEQDKAVSCK